MIPVVAIAALRSAADWLETCLADPAADPNRLDAARVGVELAAAALDADVRALLAAAPAAPPAAADPRSDPLFRFRGTARSRARAVARWESSQKVNEKSS